MKSGHRCVWVVVGGNCGGELSMDAQHSVEAKRMSKCSQRRTVVRRGLALELAKSASLRCRCTAQ